MAAQAGSSPLGPGSWLQGGATLEADADAALWKEMDFGLLGLPLPRCVNHKEGRPCGGRTFVGARSAANSHTAAFPSPLFSGRARTTVIANARVSFSSLDYGTPLLDYRGCCRSRSTLPKTCPPQSATSTATHHELLRRLFESFDSRAPVAPGGGFQGAPETAEGAARWFATLKHN